MTHSYKDTDKYQEYAVDFHGLVEHTDDEVTEKLKRRANIMKHLKSVNDAAPAEE